MARTLGDLASTVLDRLGDADMAIWSTAEIDAYLITAYQTVATDYRVFWDWIYSENLPAHFSYTQAWERDELVAVAGSFLWGQANYTTDDDRRMGLAVPADELDRVGPSFLTSPADLASAIAWTDAPTLPATDVLPDAVQQIDRAVGDNKAMDAIDPRVLAGLEARYLLTPGAVEGYLWELDGLHTMRKWRVPAAVCDHATITGSWGIGRDVSDLSDDSVTGTFGCARQIPGEHPMGTSQWGIPRRPYLEGNNVRLEVFRLGADMVTATDLCELPDRYADGLMDAAQAQALARPGAGQDLTLAKYYEARWARVTARIMKRTRLVRQEQTCRMGGSGPSFVRVNRPRLPYPYPVVPRAQ